MPRWRGAFASRGLAQRCDRPRGRANAVWRGGREAGGLYGCERRRPAAVRSLPVGLRRREHGKRRIRLGEGGPCQILQLIRGLLDKAPGSRPGCGVLQLTQRSAPRDTRPREVGRPPASSASPFRPFRSAVSFQPLPFSCPLSPFVQLVHFRRSLQASFPPPQVLQPTASFQPTASGSHTRCLARSSWRSTVLSVQPSWTAISA